MRGAFLFKFWLPLFAVFGLPILRHLGLPFFKVVGPPVLRRWVLSRSAACFGASGRGFGSGLALLPEEVVDKALWLTYVDFVP